MKQVILQVVAPSLLLLVLAATPVVQAQSATFAWAKYLGDDPKWDLGAAGYSTVPRHGLADSGGNTILAYHGDRDVNAYTNNAVVKLDPTGRVLWVQRKLPFIRKLATDTSGSIYVVGSRLFASAYNSFPFVVPADFFSQLGIPNAGTGSAYIAKLSATGEFEWVRQMGGAARVDATDVRVLPDGSYYVAGYYARGSAQFGNVTLPAPSGVNAGHFFLTRFSAGGQVEWARAGVGSSIAWNPEIAADSDGNVVMTGISDQGPYAFEEGHSTGDGGFVVQFNAEGKLTWTVATRNSTPRVAVDHEGNVFVASGEWRSTLILHKYSPNSQLLWTKEAPSDTWSEPTQLLVSGDGSCYMVGAFTDQSPGVPGEVQFDQTTITTLARNEMFIAKYSPSGDVKWVLQSEGLDPNVNGSITQAFFAGVDSFGTVTLAGAILGLVRFGDTLLQGGVGEVNWLPVAARIVDTESVQPTLLSVERVADKLQLSWPATSGGFMLETAETISSTAWTPVSSNPVRDAGQEVVALSVESGIRFFRLRKP